MELFRSHSNSNRQSIKFKLPCQQRITNDTESNTTASWLTVESLLSYTNGNVAILKGILERSKAVAVKFGDLSEILTEYKAAEKLFEANLTGFMKFICMFQCNDDFREILAQNYLSRPHICHGEGDGIGTIVMPYYPLGSLDNYKWTKKQIPEFKNVLKQVCFALFVAFKTTGFVHMDLHAGNIVLRATKKRDLDYNGHASLPVVGGKYAMIMDFQKYCLNDDAAFVRSLERVIHTACTSSASDVVFDFHSAPVRTWAQRHTDLTTEAFSNLAAVIDDIELRFVRSEIPIMRWN